MRAPLFLDLESSPLVVHVWNLVGNQYINPENVITDRTILAAGWAWGDGPVQYASTEDQKDPRDDRKLVKVLARLVDEADVVVGHNAQSFDRALLHARMLTHNMAPPSPYKVFDTKRAAKKAAAFTSNKLAWLSPLLGGEQKGKHREFPGLELWTECLAGNPKAWKAMQEYNIMDIVTLRQVYKRLRPWVTSSSPGYEMDESGLPTCPRCGSVEGVKRGVTRTGSGEYQRYQCRDCGGWYRERTSSRRRRTAQEEA